MILESLTKLYKIKIEVFLMSVFGMIFWGNNNKVVGIQGNTRMKTSGTTRHSVENFIFDLHKAI